jgi:hypothetical protein
VPPSRTAQLFETAANGDSNNTGQLTVRILRACKRLSARSAAYRPTTSGAARTHRLQRHFALTQCHFFVLGLDYFLKYVAHWKSFGQAATGRWV